ncbi:mechanosensitive ion channel family protein [Streptomyces alkaliterrae]|uniref:Mechanosensitive ion channel n=1 Tax=Streptomyces alkaliterrae TaxID=2213162 RepID=A0A5P0YJV4_9ACTN|nr:mechanosensitive ion channel domain-containing protein [Streptomyces alkaliterrae]MBB1253246.1 mechanosensitive ion channel [Streptomyces alkaliterrae]MBB1260231.1 mechanosensitive ion channel [Streptomyces alkaliterrae]MQS00518.1 mechanosensitive ion channel [Streptomyces alkaliterrae]
MEYVLRPTLVFGGALVLSWLIAWAVDLVLVRVNARHPETPMWGLLRRVRVPLQALLFVALVRGFFESTKLVKEHQEVVRLWLSLILIAASAWLALRVLAAVVETVTVRYSGVAQDPARIRRVRTQLTLIQRLATAVVTVVAAAAMMLQFDAMKTVGTSMLASAGVLGIVAGIAAQSTLGNLFAGLSIAFGDMVRIGDVVVVDGEWGTVDEITVSYLVVLTWDERRITMPVSYFTSKPFENWSRGGPQMTGTVFLHLDHTTPIAELRARTEEVIRASDHWDGRNWGLVVTDSTPSTIEVRASMTARTADDIWALRCQVREALVTWLQEKHPHALPRVRVAREDASPEEKRI